jgi:hypothetical protein
MTGNEKATSYKLAGRPEVAPSTQRYYIFILWIKQADRRFRIIWQQEAVPIVRSEKNNGGNHDYK